MQALFQGGTGFPLSARHVQAERSSRPMLAQQADNFFVTVSGGNHQCLIPVIIRMGGIGPPLDEQARKRAEFGSATFRPLSGHGPRIPTCTAQGSL